jgi:hypothetical protein
MEPFISLTAGAIAQLAFGEFVKSGAGELAKKSIGETISIAKKLRDGITERFKNNEQATIALEKIQKQGDPKALRDLVQYLDIELKADNKFATDLTQIASQIENNQNQTAVTLKQQNINHGRDQNIINQPQGNISIGGS